MENEICIHCPGAPANNVHASLNDKPKISFQMNRRQCGLTGNMCGASPEQDAQRIFKQVGLISVRVPQNASAKNISRCSVSVRQPRRSESNGIHVCNSRECLCMHLQHVRGEHKSYNDLSVTAQMVPCLLSSETEMTPNDAHV